MINVLKLNKIQFRDGWGEVDFLDKHFIKNIGESVKSFV